MSPSKALILLFLVLAAATSGVCQDRKMKVDKNGHLEITPEMLEQAKRRSERLRDPSFIKLKLEPVSNCLEEGDLKHSKCYKTGGSIKMRILMTNTSREPITISVHDSYYPYHLQLVRDGDVVPYRQGVAEKMGQQPAAIYGNFSVILEPGKTVMADMISLDKWYEPLKPGHYQLEIKRRFRLDGVWTAPASATFHVD